MCDTCAGEDDILSDISCPGSEQGSCEHHQHNQPDSLTSYHTLLQTYIEVITEENIENKFFKYDNKVIQYQELMWLLHSAMQACV